MSGLARELVSTEAQKDERTISVRALTVRHTACDKDGVFLFTDDDLADLSNEPYNELDKIATVAYSLNEMTAADLETLKKTLANIHSDASSSASPAS
jgi:hypothetical protein